MTIQEAKEEEKPIAKESNNFKSKKPADKKGKKDFVSKNTKGGKGAKPKNADKAKQGKKTSPKGKGNKPISRKSKFYSGDED